MKLFRRITACLSACIIVAGTSLLGYADNSQSGYNSKTDYAIVDMDEYQAYLDSLTDEQRQILEAKERGDFTLADIPGESTNSSARAALIGLPGTFTMYQQIKNDYCGIACVFSALTYINGFSQPQDSLYVYVGNNFSKIPSYMNENQNKCTYFMIAGFSQKTLTDHIKSDIVSWNVPSFLRIERTEKPDWSYETNGHCVLSNGIYDDASRILIADPLGEKAPDTPYFYLKDTETVYKYITHMCW